MRNLVLIFLRITHHAFHQKELTMKKLICLLVFLLAACAPAAVPAAQSDAPFPKPGPLASEAHVYPVETGWLDGKSVRYYNMGSNSPLDPADPTQLLAFGCLSQAQMQMAARFGLRGRAISWILPPAKHFTLTFGRLTSSPPQPDTLRIASPR